MESSVLFLQSCRICSADIQQGILVFGDEGKQLYLQAKIRKYLYITVSMDDRLPKIICDNCCNKLEGIHKFATMAVKNQDKFNKLMTDTNAPALQPKQVENKGLLHTYLTKGIIEKPQIEDTEEMEVRLDPMLFLQYNSEEEQTAEGEDDEDIYFSDAISEAEQQSTNKFNGQEVENQKEFRPFSCTMCSKSFHSEFALQQHVWCHITKKGRVVLNNHNNFYMKPENNNDLNGTTDENLQSETEDGDANNQCDGDSSENIRFTCPICGKLISTKGNLKVHLETHRPKGKYGCDICGRIFKTLCNLHRHKEYHTGIQFTCNVCGRVYPTNSTLRAHSITHSDLRPHKCPLCDKTFKRNQDLKFHINQHTGARPYKCPYCPKAFASSGNCFSHRKRMHPVEVERDREKAAKIMR